VFDFLKSSSGIRALAVALLDTGDDRQNCPLTFQEKCLLFTWSFVCEINMNISFLFVKQTVWKQPPHFNTAFMGKSVSTNISGLRTPYIVTSGDDGGL